MKLGINLHKEIYKTDDEIKELNKWRNIPYSWIGRFNIVKISILPNLTYRFNTIPIKITASYFGAFNKPTWSLYREEKTNSILAGDQNWRSDTVWFETYYKPTSLSFPLFPLLNPSCPFLFF